MLTLFAGGAESLWDEMLPEEVRVLPDDLARLDELLADPELLVPIAVRWERELAQAGRVLGSRAAVAGDGDLRAVDGAQAPLRVGVRDVDAGGFGLDSSAAFLPAGTDRAGARRVDGAQADPPAGGGGGAPAHARGDREGAAGEAVSSAGGADRLDRGRGRHSLSDRCRAGGRRRPGAGAGGAQAGGQDQAPSAPRSGIARARSARRLRGITRTMRRRSGQAKAEVLKLTEQTGELLAESVKEARRLAAEARRRARGRGAQAKLKAARELEQLADRCEKVRRADQQAPQGREDHRPAGLAVGSRRAADPQGQALKPNQFGYVDQLCEITANTKPGARGFILPPASQIGNPAENTLLPDTAAELQNLDITLREVMVDGGFMPSPDQRRARGPGRRGSHHRPPGTRLPAHPPPPTALPHRRRRTGQPPQTRLRPAPQPAQRRRRPPDLGRMGGLHLQRRHLHHPPVRKQPLTGRGTGEDPAGSSRKDDHPSTTRPPAPPFLTRQHRPRRLSGGSN